MKTLLLLTIIGTVLIAVGLLGLFWSVTKRLYDLERELDYHKKEITNHKRDLFALKNRKPEKSESDNIYIYHRYDDSSAPIYPSKEGL